MLGLGDEHQRCSDEEKKIPDEEREIFMRNLDEEPENQENTQTDNHTSTGEESRSTLDPGIPPSAKPQRESEAPPPEKPQPELPPRAPPRRSTRSRKKPAYLGDYTT